MKMLRAISLLLLICVISSPAYAASKSKRHKAAKPIKKQAVVNAKKHILGTIMIFSTIKGADIYVDEDIIGKAPVIMPGMKPGKHLIEAYIKAELVYRKYVILEEGKTLHIYIRNLKEIATEDPNFII